MICIVQQIITLNNCGTKHLQIGNLYDAFLCFTRASTILGHFKKTSNQDASVSFIGASWLEISAKLLKKLSSRRGRARGVPLSNLYRRAIRLNGSMAADEKQNESRPLTLCWAVLYNLALSCHLLAYQDDKKDTTYLRRAIDLYEIVRINYLDSTPVEHKATQLLAIYNNLGCIYEYLGDADESDSCLRKVREFMDCLSSERYGADWKLFGLNIVALGRSRVANAA